MVVIDSQDDYSTALAKGTTYRFRLKGVKVDRESVAATDTDFSSIVTNVASDVQVVVFATQTASAANTLSNQLREQGKKAVVLGTDGAYSPSAVQAAATATSPRSRRTSGSCAGGASVVRAYNVFSKNKTFGTFGPPSYMATWVLMGAINTACRDGSATRAEVTANVRQDEHPVDPRRPGPVHEEGRRGRREVLRLQDHEREVHARRVGTRQLDGGPSA